MMDIPDAPWIRECESTGYCSSGWWNHPPVDVYADDFIDEDPEEEDEDADSDEADEE